MTKRQEKTEEKELSAETILAGFEKLFDPESRGVRRFEHSGVRYVKLKAGAVLVEQNPKKNSRWAEMARSGHRIAWAMRDGEYLARVIDGQVEMLNRPLES
ncbi:MAG TPA: hypothetical protein VD966_07095 [Pyrinomonadaceae bacterium]|nr:hypothetical protein [Pyrinomonadaceae bacterium]